MKRRKFLKIIGLGLLGSMLPGKVLSTTTTARSIHTSSMSSTPFSGGASIEHKWNDQKADPVGDIARYVKMIKEETGIKERY